MKLFITFKTPDALDYALSTLHSEYENVTDEEKEQIRHQLRKWISYGENVTIEFNIENNTATVCEALN